MRELNIDEIRSIQLEILKKYQNIAMIIILGIHLLMVH